MSRCQAVLLYHFDLLVIYCGLTALASGTHEVCFMLTALKKKKKKKKKKFKALDLLTKTSNLALKIE